MTAGTTTGLTTVGLAELAAFAALGFVGGIVYFWALRENLRSFAAGRRPLAAAIFMIRLAAAGVLFWVIAGWGAGALLAALLGFIAARLVSLRRVLGES